MLWRTTCVVRWGLLVVLAALAAGCGGGGGGKPIVPPPPTGAREVTGYVFGALRTVAAARAGEAGLATERTPLADVTVSAYLLPATGSALATTRTDRWGRFQFTQTQALPAHKSLALIARGGGQTVSAVVLTDAVTQIVVLDEVTHVASLAIRANEGSSVTRETIGSYQMAARQATLTALQQSPGISLTADGQQVAASAAAAEARRIVRSGSQRANTPPRVGPVVLSPSQLPAEGGTTRVDVDVTDADSPLVAVHALVYDKAGEAPRVVELTYTDGQATGTLRLPTNQSTVVRQSAVVVVADDGTNAPVSSTPRIVAVLPPGTVTLDILAETLWDEAVARSQPDWERLLERLAPRVRPATRARTRQVNPNQSIAGVAITVDDVPSLGAKTGADGLVSLTVPLSAVTDGLLGVRATMNDRVTYHQFLILPAASSIANGDVIEIDMTMGTQADWRRWGDLARLTGVDFAKVPAFLVSNVQRELSLAGVSPMSTFWNPIDDKNPRTDDGDWLAAGVTPGAASLRGVFTHPVDPGLTYPFGPVAMELTAGEATAVGAILPPAPAAR